MTERAPGFFEGTGMPDPGWWEALSPDPAKVLRDVGVAPGMEVVDLCCGDGWFTFPLTKIARTVIAIDIDARLLAAAKVRIVGCAVGAPFAVLIAEELFACGCRLLISVTSAGQIVPAGPTPYFVIIDRALRDEGTSYHYAEPSEYGEADPALVEMAAGALTSAGLRTIVGATWTTDAPFRETAEAIEAAKARGILAVEMEAAALYTFAKAKAARVLCIAHVTNTMGQAGEDFEKGEADGTADALAVLAAIASVATKD